MRKRIFAALVVTGALAASGGAFAHDDSTPDSNQCDRWWRNNHGTNDTSGHHHTNGEDTDLGVAYFHRHPSQGDQGDVGHYVIRTRYGYIEVVGGGSYGRPNPPGGNNQGGFVEGEIDPGVGGVDADFHASTFTGTNNGGNAGMVPGPAYTEGNGCANVAGQHVERWHNSSRPNSD